MQRALAPSILAGCLASYFNILLETEAHSFPCRFGSFLSDLPKGDPVIGANNTHTQVDASIPLLLQHLSHTKSSTPGRGRGRGS